MPTIGLGRGVEAERAAAQDAVTFSDHGEQHVDERLANAAEERCGAGEREE